ADDRGEEVLVVPAEAPDEGGAVRAAPLVHAARIDRIDVLRPLDQSEDVFVVRFLPSGAARLPGDDEVLVAQAEPLGALDRAAEVVVLVAVEAVVKKDQAEGL